MRSCLVERFLPLTAVFGVACGGGAGAFSDDPVAPLPGVLCAKGSVAGWADMISDRRPAGSASWAAIQRENQPWQTIDATEAIVTLSPGERIGMARWLPALGPHTGDFLQIFFLTAEQAQTAFPCVSSSTKSMHGTA